MGWRKQLAESVNIVLKPLGAALVRTVNGDTEKPWDHHFAKWIADAKTAGTDPNDVGDLAWNEDPVKEALEKHYFPHVHSDSVVLELGPGTGRVTRHIISRCREMILVDFSKLVCDWLEEYLKGKGRYRIYYIDKPLFPMVSSGSVHAIIANGVFEHIDMDDFVCFLEEFYRVLNQSGVASFGFVNIMNEEGIQWFKRWRREPGIRCIFRFYHPEMVRYLAESVGFKTLRLTTGLSRVAYIELMKPVP